MANRKEKKLRKEIEARLESNKVEKARKAVDGYSKKVEQINPNLPAKEPGKIRKWFKKMRVYIALGLGITTIGVGAAAATHNNKDDKSNDDKKIESLESSKSNVDDIKKELKDLTADKEIEKKDKEQTTTQEQSIEETEQETTQSVKQQYQQEAEAESINKENISIASEDIGDSFVENETAKTDLDKTDDVVIKSNNKETQKETKNNKEKETEQETKKVEVEDKTISIDADAKVEDGTIKTAEGDTHVEVEIVEQESTETPEIIIEPENPFADDIEAYVVTPEEAASNKKDVTVEITEDGTIDGKDIANQIDEYYK